LELLQLKHGLLVRELQLLMWSHARWRGHGYAAAAAAAKIARAIMHGRTEATRVRMRSPDARVR
jgi:hypothetical protein